jgi:CheY-like chemotaxis protein
VKKILIVEDNEDNLDLLVQLLEERFELVTAIDGIQAVEIARKDHPDLVLMDMALPRLDGWEATRIIKSTPEIAHIPVVGVSSHAMPEDEIRARQVGCDEYVTKPLDETALYEIVNRYLGEM